jgi:hypothetical protein
VCTCQALSRLFLGAIGGAVVNRVERRHDGTEIFFGPRDLEKSLGLAEIKNVSFWKEIGNWTMACIFQLSTLDSSGFR